MLTSLLMISLLQSFYSTHFIAVSIPSQACHLLNQFSSETLSKTISAWSRVLQLPPLHQIKSIHTSLLSSSSHSLLQGNYIQVRLEHDVTSDSTDFKSVTLVLPSPNVAQMGWTTIPSSVYVRIFSLTYLNNMVIKSLKGKSNASARWVRRQWSDPVVKQAQREGLRSRAAIKLRQLNDRFQLLKRGDVVLDLGAAPGGWSQVAVEATTLKSKIQSQGTRESLPTVVAVDLKSFDPVEGTAIVVGDFRHATVRKQLSEALRGRKADVVLSDMAPSFSGNFLTDSQAQLRLCHNALKMAELYLRPGGNFATKILRCEGSEDFRAELKTAFDVVKAMKPSSSRPESTEMFMVAKGFKKCIDSKLPPEGER